MGCLAELFLEVFFELFLEIIWHCYIKIVTLIFPEHDVKQSTHGKIKKVVTSVSVLLAMIMVIGIICLIQDDYQVIYAGQLMTFIPLGIFSALFLSGIIAKIVTAKKKKRRK